MINIESMGFTHVGNAGGKPHVIGVIVATDGSRIPFKWDANAAGVCGAMLVEASKLAAEISGGIPIEQQMPIAADEQLARRVKKRMDLNEVTADNTIRIDR